MLKNYGKAILVSVLTSTTITWAGILTLRSDTGVNIVTKSDIGPDASILNVLESNADASRMRLTGGGHLLASPSYGTLYAAAGTTLVIPDDATYHQFVSFTVDGCSEDIVCSAASDNMTVTVGGTYFIAINTLATYDLDAHDVHPNVYVNGVEASTTCHQGAVSAKHTDISGTLVCNLAVNAGDVLDLRFEDATAGGKPATITFKAITFNITRLN